MAVQWAQPHSLYNDEGLNTHDSCMRANQLIFLKALLFAICPRVYSCDKITYYLLHGTAAENGKYKISLGN